MGFVEDGRKDWVLVAGEGPPKASVEKLSYATEARVGVFVDLVKFYIYNRGEGGGRVAWKLCLVRGPSAVVMWLKGKNYTVGVGECLEETLLIPKPGLGFYRVVRARHDAPGFYRYRLVWGHFE